MGERDTGCVDGEGSNPSISIRERAISTGSRARGEQGYDGGMTRLVPVLAATLFAFGCRTVAEPTPSAPPAEASEPLATKPSVEPKLWLEAEHFDSVEATPPPPSERPPRPGFDTTPVAHQLDPDGLEWTDYTSGEGTAAASGSQLRLDYVGVLDDGQVFDSTYERNLPFEFELGAKRVIPGFERGLAGVRAGVRRKLVIPPELAYGDHQRGTIPANATLVFYIEVLSVD